VTKKLPIAPSAWVTPAHPAPLALALPLDVHQRLVRLADELGTNPRFLAIQILDAALPREDP